MSQSLSSRAMSFDVYKCDRCDGSTWSQSLSSRAMSFDKKERWKYTLATSLNPFRAGRCLSTLADFDTLSNAVGLNPFRAGRCLSTSLLMLL